MTWSSDRLTLATLFLSPILRLLVIFLMIDNGKALNVGGGVANSDPSTGRTRQPYAFVVACISVGPGLVTSFGNDANASLCHIETKGIEPLS